MSNIIIPGQGNVEPLSTGLSISWSRDDVPQVLQEDLDVNPHLFDAYVKAVKTAMERSFNHPDTRPRVLSEQVMKERLKQCHDALVTMRNEMNMSLRRCFDILPQKFLEALSHGKTVADMAEEGSDKMRWAREAEPRLHVVKDKDITNEDPSDAPEVTQEMRDVAGISEED